MHTKATKVHHGEKGPNSVRHQGSMNVHDSARYGTNIDGHNGALRSVMEISNIVMVHVAQHWDNNKKACSNM